MFRLCPDARLLPQAYLRSDDVAACLQVEVGAVEGWCRSRVIPAVDDKGWWIRVDDFERFLTECTWSLRLDDKGQPVKRKPSREGEVEPGQ